MKNREKYAKEILDIACQGRRIAMTLDGDLVPCGDMSCGKCKFSEGCDTSIREWCESEYVEKSKISENDRQFLDYLPDEYKWIARCENGDLCVFKDMQQKGRTPGSWSLLGTCFIISCDFYKINFPMIKVKDEKPWKIEVLKNLEVGGYK